MVFSFRHSNSLGMAFLFAFQHDKKDAQSMLEGIELLDTILGSELCSTDLRELGLLDQNDMNTVISHVNSSPKEKLYGNKIDKDKITLKPYLINR